MAIRFHCQQCHQLLSIASRKAGTVVECPRCAALQLVPNEDEPAASLEPPVVGQEPAEPIEDDGDLTMLDEPPIAPPLATPLGVVSPPCPDDTPLRPSDWIVFRRRIIYLQGLLFLVLAAVCFAFGLVVGRTSTYVAPVRAPRQAVVAAAEQEQVFIDGKLVYDAGGGIFMGDEDAVVILLPEGHPPVEPIAVSGLCPQDPAPTDLHPGLRSIGSLGGVYVRADVTGAFTAVLPRAGTYHVLLISRHAQRPEDGQVDDIDREKIGKYFQRPAELIGRSKYRWTREEFRPNSPPLTYSFGSGQ